MSEKDENEAPFEAVEEKSETFGAETPVTGKTKMQAAWTAERNEADNSAKLASVSQGQIFEQIYQPWEGTLNPRWMRNWAILRHHILGIFKKGHRPWNIPTRLFIFFVILAAMTDAALALLFGMIGEPTLYDIWGVNRDNLYGHVMGFFPRNILYFNTFVEEVFTSEKPMDLINSAGSYLADIRGNRWARATGGGKGTNNFSSLFE